MEIPRHGFARQSIENITLQYRRFDIVPSSKNTFRRLDFGRKWRTIGVIANRALVKALRSRVISWSETPRWERTTLLSRLFPCATLKTSAVTSLRHSCPRPRDLRCYYYYRRRYYSEVKYLSGNNKKLRGNRIKKIPAAADADKIQ